jgi:hypothetical protein
MKGGRPFSDFVENRKSGIAQLPEGSLPSPSLWSTSIQPLAVQFPHVPPGAVLHTWESQIPSSSFPSSSLGSLSKACYTICNPLQSSSSFLRISVSSFSLGSAYIESGGDADDLGVEGCSNHWLPPAKDKKFSYFSYLC